MYTSKEGLVYSKERFEEYKYRAQVKFLFKDHGEITIDIYTTDVNKDNVAKVLAERMTKNKGKFLGVTHWASREQDDLSSIMIDEWLAEMDKEDNSNKEEPFVYEEDY
jgi:hypothetical protein